MSLIDDIESRSKMTEDGLLFEPEDARRLLGIARILQSYVLFGGGHWARLRRVQVALEYQDFHQLDLALDSPRQELK